MRSGGGPTRCQDPPGRPACSTPGRAGFRVRSLLAADVMGWGAGLGAGRVRGGRGAEAWSGSSHLGLREADRAGAGMGVREREGERERQQRLAPAQLLWLTPGRGIRRAGIGVAALAVLRVWCERKAGVLSTKVTAEGAGCRPAFTAEPPSSAPSCADLAPRYCSLHLLRDQAFVSAVFPVKDPSWGGES